MNCFKIDPISVYDLRCTWPGFTDHALVMFTISSSKTEPDIQLRRDWRNYNKEKLCHALAQLDWEFISDSVQPYWDALENQLVAIIDELVHLVQHKNSSIVVPVPAHVKHKLNLRKRLIRSNNNLITREKTERIKKLNKEIKSHFHTRIIAKSSGWLTTINQASSLATICQAHLLANLFNIPLMCNLVL